MIEKLKKVLARGARMLNRALDASRYDEAWGPTPWPLRENDAFDAFDLLTTWQRARMLYENSPQVAAIVEEMVRFIGPLKPLPTTTDEEWNELALRAFTARTKHPATFDAAGRVNYVQAMNFMERRCIIDGDVAMVPTYGRDGGALFAFYTAPQVAGGGTQGAELDSQGRTVAYYFTEPSGAVKRVPAWQVLLYQHRPDPTRLRGRTPLASVMRHAHDESMIVRYSKQGLKLACSMGLVTTRTEKAKADMFAAGLAGAKGCKEEAPPAQELGTGLNILHLPQGYDIKTISDTRPSQQLQAFIAHLDRSIAMGAATLDPELTFFIKELGSAATRVALEKLRKWQEMQHADQEIVCNRIWQHVIACEIAVGRLRPCQDPEWANVRWVPGRDMSIDLARVATSHINLSREGLADDEDYTLRTTGMTPQRLARRKAALIAYQKQVAAEYGIGYDELVRGMVGSTSPVRHESAEVQPEPDEDPEVVTGESE